MEELPWEYLQSEKEKTLDGESLGLTFCEKNMTLSESIKRSHRKTRRQTKEENVSRFSKIENQRI